MLTTTITVTGKTSADLEEGIGEVTRLISEGFTSGFNRNDSGSFTFDTTGEEEEEAEEGAEEDEDGQDEDAEGDAN